MATTVDAKLLKSTKFPAEFNQKVDMQKVNLEVMKRFVASYSPSNGHETNFIHCTDGLQARLQLYWAMKMMWL